MVRAGSRQLVWCPIPYRTQRTASAKPAFATSTPSTRFFGRGVQCATLTTYPNSHSFKTLKTLRYPTRAQPPNPFRRLPHIVPTISSASKHVTRNASLQIGRISLYATSCTFLSHQPPSNQHSATFFNISLRLPASPSGRCQDNNRQTPACKIHSTTASTMHPIPVQQ